jgi:hypothetical protein
MCWGCPADHNPPGTLLRQGAPPRFRIEQRESAAEGRRQCGRSRAALPYSPCTDEQVLAEEPTADDVEYTDARKGGARSRVKHCQPGSDVRRLRKPVAWRRGRGTGRVAVFGAPPDTAARLPFPRPRAAPSGIGSCTYAGPVVAKGPKGHLTAKTAVYNPGNVAISVASQWAKGTGVPDPPGDEHDIEPFGDGQASIAVAQRVPRQPAVSLDGSKLNLKRIAQFYPDVPVLLVMSPRHADPTER